MIGGGDQVAGFTRTSQSCQLCLDARQISGIEYAGQPHGIAGHWNNIHRMLSELEWWKRYMRP